MFVWPEPSSPQPTGWPPATSAKPWPPPAAMATTLLNPPGTFVSTERPQATTELAAAADWITRPSVSKPNASTTQPLRAFALDILRACAGIAETCLGSLFSIEYFSSDRVSMRTIGARAHPKPRPDGSQARHANLQRLRKALIGNCAFTGSMLRLSHFRPGWNAVLTVVFNRGRARPCTSDYVLAAP